MPTTPAPPTSAASLAPPKQRPRLLSRTTGGAAKVKNTVVASHGRAPWYGPDGKTVDAYVIGIAGGSSSGKTSVARAILSALDWIPTVLILSQDAFYRHHTPEEVELAFKNDLDLDHPDSIDMALFAKCLDNLKHGRATEIPVYSFNHHQRMPEKKYLYGASVIIVEGIMALQSPEMRKHYDLKVFVNCDSDVMLGRRIKRDTVERGRDVHGILDQYFRFVKSSYDNFVQPSSKFADIIVPGSNNETAIELLVTHVKRQLEARSLRFRNMLASPTRDDDVGNMEDDGVVLLEQTNQLLGIMTILRDQTTTRGDFIFYADRLSTLIVERALSLLPFESKQIQTPTGTTYNGLAPAKSPVVGVSILRSGGPFSHGLRRVIRDVPIGALLIQSDPKTGEPLLLNVKLPQCIKSAETSASVSVLLLDSQMGTGAAALMAIRVLLDHGVLERNIVFLTYLVSRHAVRTVHRAFPAVRVVTAAIDSGLDEMHFPLSATQMVGEASGDPDFAMRVVDVDAFDEEMEGSPSLYGLSGGEGDGDGTDHGLGQDEAGQVMQGEGEDERAALGEQHGSADYRVPVKVFERLQFSRKKDGVATEKRAWVVSPGMGHIGDRYYIS